MLSNHLRQSTAVFPEIGPLLQRRSAEPHWKVLTSALLGCALFATTVGPAHASDGFTYTKVADFAAAIGPESICDFALNDNGDVAYVGQQPTTVSGMPATLFQVHLWSPTGSNQIVYAATLVQNNTLGVDTYTVPGTPYCGGFGAGSVGLAINNNRLIAIEAWIPNAGGLFQGYGELFVDPTTSPATVTAVQMPFIANSDSQLNSSGALGIATYAVGTLAHEFGSVSPAGLSTLLQGPANAAYSWNTAHGTQYGQAAINDSGLVSIIYESLASGQYSLLDVTPAGAVNSTPIVTTSSSPLGRIGLNSRGDAGFVTSLNTGTIDKVSLLTADRTGIINFIDSTIAPNPFPYSIPEYPVSLTNGWQVTFATEDSGPPGTAYSLWSVAADGIPVDIFSGLDPIFPLTDPITGLTTNVGCTSGCVGNAEYAINDGATPPSLDMTTNAKGVTIFYVLDSAAGHLVLATPKPGVNVGSPLPPTSTDPVTSIMTFSAPCGTLYTSSTLLSASTLLSGPYAGFCYVDPPVAIGYALTAATGASNFQSVIIPAPLPAGQTAFTVNYPNPVVGGPPLSAPITSGHTYTFPAGGVASFTITGINATEALQVTNSNAFELGLTWVNAAALPTDFTMQPLSDSGPTITPTVTGTLGANGWYRSNVTVSWAVTDTLATILSQTGCTTGVVATDTAGQSFTCSAASAGGTTSQTVTVKRDATPPVATVTAAPATNANGWNNGSVTVTFTGNDATSGIASCSAAVTVTTEGAAQTSPSGTCSDVAGNVSAPVNASISIDKTPPTVAISAPASGAAYAQGSAVTASYTCADTLSGVASCVGSVASGAAVNTAAAGAFAFTVTATDKAGNVTTSTVNYTVTGGTTGGAPTITPTVTGTLGQNGWYTSDVTVSFAVSPTGSEKEGCGTRTIAQNTAGLVSTCTASNKQGTTSRSVTIKRDASDPKIAFSESPTADSFGWEHSAVVVSFHCSSVSGIATCPSPITLATEGSALSVSGTAVSNAGLTATATSPAINIDLTPPTVTVTTPTNGTIYALNSPVTVSYVCADALSGLAQCSGTLPNGAPLNTTQRVTHKSFTVTGKDKAGNVSQATSYYSVN